MKAFDEIIHQALRDGIRVNFAPDEFIPGAYTATFRNGIHYSQVRVDTNCICPSVSEEAEADALIRGIDQLKRLPYQDIMCRHFRKDVKI